MDHSAPAWLVELAQHPDPIPEDLLLRIVDEGAAAVAPLLSVLDRARQHGSDDRIAIAAVQVLGEVAAVEAIAPLLDALRELDDDADLFEACRDALAAIGAPALEPLLAAYDAETRSAHRGALGRALAELHVRDERIFTRLCALQQADVLRGAPALARYDDRRVQRILRLAFEEVGNQKRHNVLDDWRIVLLASSLERSGAKLGRAHQRMLDAAQARLRAAGLDETALGDEIDEDADELPPMADCLMDLADAAFPREEGDPPLQTARTLLGMAQMAWNLEVGFLSEEDYRSKMSAARSDTENFEQFIATMREAKARLYPDDLRVVTEVDVFHRGGDLRIRAHWATRDED